MLGNFIKLDQTNNDLLHFSGHNEIDTALNNLKTKALSSLKNILIYVHEKKPQSIWNSDLK